MSPSADPIAVKTAAATIITGALSAGGWGWALASQSIETGTIVDTVLPSTALTATAGAFLWLVRLMASGKLVHFETVDVLTKLARSLERTEQLAERSLEREEHLIELAERSLEREEHLIELLTRRSDQP